VQKGLRRDYGRKTRKRGKPKGRGSGLGRKNGALERDYPEKMGIARGGGKKIAAGKNSIKRRRGPQLQGVEGEVPTGDGR